MSERFGSRFVGGYQFPTTNAASLERGEPIFAERDLAGVWRCSVELRPMLGGRPDLYVIDLAWNNAETRGVGTLCCMIDGEQRARQAFAATITHLRSSGEPPEAIPVPSDTPIF